VNPASCSSAFCAAGLAAWLSFGLLPRAHAQGPGAGTEGDSPAATDAQSYVSNAERDPELARLLKAGWSLLDAGALDKAETAFADALARPLGKQTAEVYYALAAAWWERRNALAAYNRLKEGSGDASRAPSWDPGSDREWERRIAGRIRYIERNFSAAKMRCPERGRALPPLADPPPADPLLRGFADSLPQQLAAGQEEGAGVIFALLPNGTWWIGNELLDHGGGGMEPHKAAGWELPQDRGRDRKRHDARVAAIAEGRSPARELLDARRAEPRRDSGAAVASAAGGSDALAAILAHGAPPKPIAYRVVAGGELPAVSADISARWPIAQFHVRYGIVVPDRLTEHEWNFPDAGVLFRIDEDGELKVRGTGRLTESLRSDWLAGGPGEINLVEIWFDGELMRVAVNGVEFGPVAVRKGAAAPLGRWEITVSDPRAEIQHLWIEPLDSPLSSS
jgi:hypothetical protein